MNYYYDISATEKENKKKSAIITIIVFLILFIIMLFIGLTKLVPPPAEEGIEIALGYSETGSGEEIPETKEVVTDPTPPAEQTPQVAEAPVEEVVTSEVEQTTTIESSEDPKPSNTEVVPTETTEEVQAEEKQEPQINQQHLANASLFNKPSNKGQNENEQGMQGKEDGSADSDQLGTANYGQGDQGIGPGLEGRSILSKPIAKNNCGESGKVTVIITVDAKGNVTSVKTESKGSTLTSACAKRLAKETAMQWRFSEDPSRPEQTIALFVELTLN